MGKAGKPRRERKRPRKKVSLQRKLFMITSAVLVVFLVVLVMSDSIMLSTVNLLQTGVSLWLASNKVDEALEDPETFSDELQEIYDSYGLSYIEIVNTKGDVVYTTLCAGADPTPPFDDYEPVGNEYIRRFIVTDPGDPDSPIGKYFMLYELKSAQSTVEYLALGSKLSTGDTVIYVMQKSQLDVTAKVSVIFLSVLALLLLMIALFVEYKYIGHFVKPLKQISGVTQKMAAFEFDEKCPPSEITEIDRLSNSVNDMSDSLSAALEDLRQRNKKLQEDIEQERTIDQIRRTFISGVSHELKTPIAIIQGYAEGAEMFLDRDPEKAKEYVRTISEESQRMNNLVMSLLELTKYDSGEYRIANEEFCIRSMASDWVDRNAGLLAEKGVTATVEIDPSLRGVGDTTILSSVINNYLSNACSHVAGAMVIRVTADDLGDRVRVYVYNSGSSIAEKDMDKIWTSFYRADKAMSRSQGRFGLGLAIVASIQKLHGMDYGAENYEDGVRFWFDIRAAGTNTKEASE